ncbi:MAG: DUF342 domain-containing protein [Planctomycetes bacterium]|nr:DUF342 domain-containing protein [Planctomycetota bacterium]
MKQISDVTLKDRGMNFHADDDMLVLKVDLDEGANMDFLHSFLNSRDITYGIDNKAIAEAFGKLSSGESVRGVIVARGLLPRSGREGHLEFFIDMGTRKVQVSDDEGHVDYRDVNLIKEVHSGEKICKIHAPDPGEPGVTIQGKQVLTSAGEKKKVRAGKNVRLDEDNGLVYATADGHVEYLDPLISVQEEFVVNKDIDLTIGNLKFIGGLVINGNVLGNYVLDAGKDITITVLASGATLLAKGNITVENGINGNDRSHISSQGKVTAKYINEARIEAKMGVVAHIEIVRSFIKTSGKLILANGSIRGGEITAFDGLEVKELGAPMGTPTLVTVGVDFSVDPKINKLREAITNLEEQIKKLQEAISPFMKNKLLLIKAAPDKQAAVKAILQKIEGLGKKIKEVEGMIQQLEGSRYNRTKEVKVTGQILEDVTIQIGNKKKKFDQKGSRGIVCYDKTSFEICMRRI